MSEKVRLGIVGMGGMGQFHANYLKAGKVSRCELAAVCDADAGRMSSFSDLNVFTCDDDMVRSGAVDAILIATPHYFHTTIGIKALEAGLHVLVEKPISVHIADCRRLMAAHKGKNQVFAAMFNLRTNPVYRKVKNLIEAGELGRLTRINWTVTDWFRTEAYYSSGGWRATWKGEGGGVLLNQSPHQLDLLQWYFGMPSRLRAFCGFGMRHNIEVEDEVTAYLEFPNGANGVFITSTGEAPGANRLEVVGEMGKLVLEDGKITFVRNEVSMLEFSRTAKDGFAKPEVWNVEIPVNGGGAHEEITQNFVDAILDGVPLIAPAAEGANSVELANAMVYSSLTESTIDLPLDGDAYEAHLNKLIAESTFVKQVAEERVADISGTFHK